jgi:hypothetical protein
MWILDSVKRRCNEELKVKLKFYFSQDIFRTFMKVSSGEL